MKGQFFSPCKPQSCNLVRLVYAPLDRTKNSDDDSTILGRGSCCIPAAVLGCLQSVSIPNSTGSCEFSHLRDPACMLRTSSVCYSRVLACIDAGYSTIGESARQQRCLQVAIQRERWDFDCELTAIASCSTSSKCNPAFDSTAPMHGLAFSDMACAMRSLRSQVRRRNTITTKDTDQEGLTINTRCRRFYVGVFWKQSRCRHHRATTNRVLGYDGCLTRCHSVEGAQCVSCLLFRDLGLMTCPRSITENIGMGSWSPHTRGLKVDHCASVAQSSN